MQKYYLRKIILIITILLIVSACTNTKSPTDIKADKKIATAKINVQLGMAYLERHDAQRAKQKFLLALSEAPTLPEAWYSMAYYLEVTGNKASAKEHYLKAISFAPKRGDVQNNYGTFLCRNGDYQNSIKHFLLAVKDTQYIDTADAYENAGLCALKIPNNALAKQYFEQAIKQDPNHPASLLELATLSYQDKQYKAAKDQLDAFLLLSPATPQSQALSEKLAKHINVNKKAELNKKTPHLHNRFITNTRVEDIS